MKLGLAYQISRAILIVGTLLSTPVFGEPAKEAKRALDRVLEMFGEKWVDQTASRGARGADRGPASIGPRSNTPDDVEKHPEGAKSPQKGGGAKRPDDGAGENTAANGPPQTLPYWFPMCFLADETTPTKQINDRIKYMADAYAKCGVVIEPFAYTIKGNYPADNKQVQDLAKQACNLNDRFGVRGAIQMDVNNVKLPQQMCQDPGATGCSTLCERISVSMVGPGASPILGLHESLHSNCCGRLCVNQGEGVEPAGPGIDLATDLDEDLLPFSVRNIKIFHAEEGANLQETPISKGACLSIQQGASPNDGSHQYSPGRSRYYVKAEGDKQIDITKGQSVFPDKRRAEPPRTQGKGSTDEGGGGKGTEGGGSRVTYDDAAKATQGNAKSTPPVIAQVRHLGQKENPLTKFDSAPPVAPYETFTSGGVANSSSVGGPATSVTYDDSAKKGSGAGSGGAGASPKGASGGSYENTTGGGEGLSVSGPTVAFDDNAPKGQSANYGGGGDAGPIPGEPSAPGSPGAPGAKAPIGGNMSQASLPKNLGAAGGAVTRTEKVAALAKGGKRKRGATIGRKSATFKRQTDTLVSSRPAPDFQVETSYGGDGGGEGGGSGGSSVEFSE